MTDKLYAKYIWLISIIHDAGKISFEEIARKWDNAYINDLHLTLVCVEQYRKSASTHLLISFKIRAAKVIPLWE